MDMENILRIGLSRVSESNLGDRTTYVGASDVAGCPRQAVLNKQNPPRYGLSTLIQFARGHLAEQILLKGAEKSGISFQHQFTVDHAGGPYKAHIDFVFGARKDGPLAVLEMKSTHDGVPDDPRGSWIRQLHFQMGLLQDKFPKAQVKGAIMGIDLGKGVWRLYNGFQPDREIYQGLLTRAAHIWEALAGNVSPRTEKGPLCAWCHHRPGCPAYQTEGVPECAGMEGALTEYQGLQEQIKVLQQDLDRIKEKLQEAVRLADPETLKARVGESLLTIKELCRTSIDSKALKKALPDIFQEYARTSTYEVLRIE